MFVEAVIQLHLSFLLIGLLASMGKAYSNKAEREREDDTFDFLPEGYVPFFSDYDDGDFFPPIVWLEWLGDNKWLIWLSFSISVSSATFGLSKFLKIGPVKIVNHGSEIGHAPLLGFGITMIIIASFMISKAVWVFLSVFNEEYPYPGHGVPSTISQVYLFWLLFSMTPQILMVIRSTGLNEKILYLTLFNIR